MNELESAAELEEIELELLLEGLYRRFGVDLRDYERRSVRLRILDCMKRESATTISGLQEKVFHQPECLERMLMAFSERSVGLFQDPEYFKIFRERVTPLLHTYPYVRIWHAGCSTGADVYATAILLEEEGLYHRSRIYATDISYQAIRKAGKGDYPLADAPEYSANYSRAGGRKYLSDYFTMRNGRIFFDPSLRRNVIFSEHNLATDGSFNEFQVVSCRNVLVDFNPELQRRVHGLIYESLAMFGVVGLGRHESLQRSPYEAFFETIDEDHGFYRKVI